MTGELQLRRYNKDRNRNNGEREKNGGNSSKSA